MIKAAPADIIRRGRFILVAGNSRSSVLKFFGHSVFLWWSAYNKGELRKWFF